MVVLDVGCGSRGKGDVNVDFFKGGWNKQEADQDKGEFVDPRSIPNFVVASAEYLPFKNDCFELVFSSHTIEHVHDPFRMISELVRVSSRKVVVKCPHRSGSGAHRPFHVSYFDEAWFNNSASQLGVSFKTFISVVEDAPLTQRLYQITPKFLRRLYSRNILYRVVLKVERKLFSDWGLPFEIESHLVKKKVSNICDDVVFIVVRNDLSAYKKCFLSGTGVAGNLVVDFDNSRRGTGLASAYNSLAKSFLNKNVWLVFCHQDFILHEQLKLKLTGLNKLGVYGAIGTRLSAIDFLGQITQTDSSKKGVFLTEPEYVDTLDEICLIVNTEAFRNGLCFDESFTFHYYGADLCVSAFRRGFDVMALQLSCQHKSKSLSGDIYSKCYRDLQNEFKGKWKRLLPITTTTGVVK